MQRSLACLGVWLLICLLAAAAEAQTKFRVKLDITESESSKGQVTSHLTCELRSLGDVIVVDDNLAYTLPIVAMEIPRMPGYKSAMAMSVVLKSHFDLPRFLEVILEQGEYHKDQVGVIDSFLDRDASPWQYIHTHSLRTGLYSDLKDLC